MKIGVVALFIALAGCATANNSDVQAGDAERAIARQNEAFRANARAGNLDRLMDYYSDSAVIMPPNAPAAAGRDAVRQVWSSFIGMGTVDLRLTTDDVSQSCDMASERGSYELTVTPKEGGAPVHDIGKYVVVWRKLNGQWRAVTDIFNSNMPAAH